MTILEYTNTFILQTKKKSLDAFASMEKKLYKQQKNMLTWRIRFIIISNFGCWFG